MATDTPRVHPDVAKNKASWQAFNQRGLLLPRAYWQPVKRWTHKPAPTPAPDFPNLDAWLEAEREGKLTDVPLYEPHGFTAIDSAWFLGIIPQAEVQILADRHSEWRSKRGTNPWPRVCCKCGKEFQPKPDGRQENAKRVRCVACREKGVAK